MLRKQRKVTEKNRDKKKKGIKNDYLNKVERRIDNLVWIFLKSGGVK